MATRSENPIARDLMRNPDVVLMFHGERGQRKGRVLRIRGRARFRTDGRTLTPIYALSALRYYLSPAGFANMIRHRDKFRERIRYYGERAGEGGVIEVTPESAEFVKNPM